ncbi:MAG: ComEA family DNA-binding protein [Oscillospiraceae bacterium]|nr:ComEA family DNA-binding protein [Oscillospiraceae bacterium]
MKKIGVEYLISGLALLFLIFTIGFFLGRGSRTVAVSASATVEAAETREIAAYAVTSAVGGETETTVAEVSAAESTVAEPLNLNAATADELEQLPGIGEVLALRILAYRDEHGAFQSPEELLYVSGIGATKYEDLKNLITVR